MRVYKGSSAALRKKFISGIELPQRSFIVQQERKTRNG
jgi:hypothetical protein